MNSEMSVKIRVGQDNTVYEFADRREAFDWVKSNFRAPQMVAVLSYENGKLERLDRYYFDKNKQFSMENVLS